MIPASRIPPLLVAAFVAALLGSVPPLQRSARAQEIPAGGECATILTEEGARQAIERDDRGAYRLDPRDAGPWQVRTAVHVVRTDEGLGGLTEQEVERSLERANEHFAPLGISFVMEGPIDHIDSDAFYYDIDTLAEIDQLRETNVVDHAMNVYFTENLANENGSFCGISSFTWSPHQGVVIMNACIPSIWNPSTFSHEVGHYFDLFHTHETAYGRECVDGSNCGTAGDRLCDTPADPGLNRCGPNGNDYCVDPYCVYTGAFVDPCHGDPNHPATDNMLAYSRPTCRTVFTPQQSEKAAATLVNLRPDHILDTSGAEEWTGSGQESSGPPLLHVAVRSPVSRTIACRIAIAEDRAVTARLVDASGRTVAQLTSADETMPAGTHDLFWDVGGRLPSGIYFLQVEARPAWQGPTKAAKVSRPIVVVR